MSYHMRDRGDGQVEIVLTRTILVGTFPDADLAQRFCRFLEADDGERLVAPEEGDGDILIEDEVDEVVAVEFTPPAQHRSADPDRVQLPVVTPPPRRALPVSAPASRLTEEQREAAFARLLAGEKLSAVAPDFGLTLHQLRASWAGNRQKLQARIAEGGQQACVLCQAMFTPSLSSPDRCARCSRDG